MSQFPIGSEDVISTLIAFIVLLFILVCFRFYEHDVGDVGFSPITCNDYLFTIYLGTFQCLCIYCSFSC